MNHLDEIAARLEAATPGPWEAYGTTVAAMTGPGDCGGCSGLPSPAHEPACYWSEIAGASEADAALILTTWSGNQPPRAREEQVTVIAVAEAAGRALVWFEHADGRRRTCSPAWLARHARRPLDPTPPGPPVAAGEPEALFDLTERKDR